MNNITVNNHLQKSVKKLNDLLPCVSFSNVNIATPSLVRVPISSDTAKKMLELNVKNRRVRKAAVEYLKQQILNGEWRDDHPQPIVFSSSGRLIDGQHRVFAIAELNISENEALIVRVETGADDSVREYMDTGVPRTLDDRVEVTPNQLHNQVISQLCTFSLAVHHGWGVKKPSPEYFKEWFVRHEESSLFIAENHKREKAVGKIQISYAAMEYYEISNLKAHQFYTNIFIPDSPIQQARMLRDYALRTIGTSASSVNTLGYRLSLYAKSIYCMKAHLIDKEIKIIREAKWN